MCSLPVPLRNGRIGWCVLLAFALGSMLHAQTDGTRKWASATLSSFVQGNILSSPAVAPDGTVYIGVEVGASTTTTPGGKLFAIAPNGTPKWSFSTNDWIDSTPAVASDGTIYFGCWDGYLYALNPNGTQKWRFALGAYASASPAIGPDGTIYIGTGTGNLYAVNPDGSQKWFFPTLYWIEGAPAVAPDGTIYVGSDDNNFYALKSDGTERWHYTMGNDVASSPAIAADGTVYIGSRDLKLYAFAPSGALKWSFQTTDMIDASPVIGADGTVYFATTGGRLFALRTDGTQKWQYPAASQAALGSIYSTPAVRADGTIVFGGSDNAVYAIGADGALRWKSPVGDWADSSPVVAPDGTIYIGCTDKNLYAFTGTSEPLFTDWAQFLRNGQRTGYQPLGLATGTTGRLSNLSVRTTAGSDSNKLIVGFTVGGSGSRSLLIRGVGPTLANFSVSGFLSDPSIALFPAGSATATLTNDNWSLAGNAAAISTTASSLGAFPLPSGSLDAAMLNSFNPGSQTVQVSGANSTTGIALVELYDAGGTSSARLTNVSARSYVNVDAGVLIAGFVVTGGTRCVLIRGIGPALSRYGVSGVVANPQLRIYNAAQQVVAENDDWSVATNAATIASTSGAIGAFGLDAGSKDAVMLVTLPAGSYTAQVSGVGRTTGVGLIEVYEVP